MNYNWKKLLRKYNLVIEKNPEGLLIKKQFTLLHAGNASTLFYTFLFLFGPFLLLLVEKSGGAYFLIGVCVLIGLVMLAMVIKEATDYVLIKNREIIIRNSMLTKVVSLDNPLKMRIDRSLEEETYKNRIIGYYWIYELYLIGNKKEWRVLDFDADEKDKGELEFLVNTLRKMIKQKFPHGLSMIKSNAPHRPINRDIVKVHRKIKKIKPRSVANL